LIVPSPGAAQAGGAVSILTDDRFRGYSLSDGRPVAILDLTYDAPNGLYAAVSGSVAATRNDGLQPLGLQLNGGYARRLNPNLTLDVGATRSTYSHYSSRAAYQSYTEAYAGLSGKYLSGRIYLSPDYLKPGLWSAYGELNGSVATGTSLRFTGHAGLLLPFERYAGGEEYRPEFDWRLGLDRDFGPVTASVFWTGTKHREERYPYRLRATNKLGLGLRYAL
jgi:uncharacterized protein (TIGR02001 family)